MTHALVVWPSAPLTERLVRRSLDSLQPSPRICSSIPNSYERLVQWSTYDSIDHEAVHERSDTVLSSSFIIRKALIRKHYLAHCIENYLVKHPESILKRSVPRTWTLDISFADEIDEKWSDDLWDLGEELDNSDGNRWWILKPGMADRGNGIRMFNSKEMLESILKEFEPESDEEEEEDAEESASETAVMISQMRFFVLQEYISDPLLLDPHQIPLDRTTRNLGFNEPAGHKFHLRAYCFASGALQVYLYTRILALFSSVPYSPLGPSDGAGGPDLKAHLTNTSLQTHLGEENVRLLSELVGCQIISASGGPDSRKLNAEDIESIILQMSAILAETFKAALQMSVHFQPLPNAFELYGVDFLVSHVSDSSGRAKASQFQVQLLEMNAEPAIELTGPRLTWILEDLFVALGKICVQPFLLTTEGENVGGTAGIETADGHDLAVRKVLDIEVRGMTAW